LIEFQNSRRLKFKQTIYNINQNDSDDEIIDLKDKFKNLKQSAYSTIDCRPVNMWERNNDKGENGDTKEETKIEEANKT